MRISRIRAAVLAFVTCVTLLIAGNISAQTKKPISKQGLVNAVKISTLSTSLVEDIKSRGVSFKMTDAIASQLRAAGATPEVIEAARTNYRSRKRSKPMMP